MAGRGAGAVDGAGAGRPLLGCRVGGGLGAAIKQAQAAGDPDDGSTYYQHVLNALEALVLEKSLTTRDALAARKEAWRAAYARTPHGQPVLLD